MAFAVESEYLRSMLKNRKVENRLAGLQRSPSRALVNPAARQRPTITSIRSLLTWTPQKPDSWTGHQSKQSFSAGGSPNRASTTMSMPQLAPERSNQPSKSQRVLACVLCQQRKIKCDRKFPCANCTKSQASCVPATLMPRRRRRMFPERELLDRLRRYEDLLRQNNIQFESLPENSTAENQFPNVVGADDSDDQHPASTPSTVAKSEPVYEAKYARP